MHIGTDSNWTYAEDTVLKANYGTVTMAQMCTLLPNRSVTAIRSRASRLGITRERPDFSDEELGIIETYIGTEGVSGVMKRLSGRSYNSIYKVARKMGWVVLKKHPTAWTVEEDRILWETMNKTPEEVQELLSNGRSVASIEHRRFLLQYWGRNGVRRGNYTRREISIIKKQYGACGADGLIDALPGRSDKAIRSKAAEMGLSRDGNSANRRWTPTEKLILQENTDKSAEEIALLLGGTRTEAAIKYRLCMLRKARRKAV